MPSCATSNRVKLVIGCRLCTCHPIALESGRGRSGLVYGDGVDPFEIRVVGGDGKISRSAMACKVSASFDKNPYRAFICRLRSMSAALMGRISMFNDAMIEAMS